MSAPRNDLLHLGPEALMQASNAGIVKRAVREWEGGYRPAWVLADDGTLTGSFSDGIRTTWPPSTPVQHVRCSCGAAGVCRHRIILALTYRADAEAPAAADSPGSTTDEALAAVVPATLLSRAAVARDAGIAIDVHRAGGGEPCDTARLPAATVRFWAGAAIEAARCDCIAAAACEHVALGVWAFRQADAQDAEAPVVRIRLGRAGERLQVERAPWHALADALARFGVARGPASIAPALTAAIESARRLKATWLVFLLEDLERWSAAYAGRSALYQPETGVDLLAELSLRLQGGEQPGHAMAVLGIGQGEESELDRLRLTCLGARTTRDGAARRTRLLLADADTGTGLLLAHAWQVPEGASDQETALRGAQKLAPGVRLESLAQGQLLARQARRRADGGVALARSRSTQNSVLPQVPDWSALPPPLRHASVAALREQQRAHPNRFLLPRHAARNFVVFTPAEVEQVLYDPGAQTLVAVLRDADGQALLLQRSHENHVRGALDAIASALSGGAGALRHVAGALTWAGGLPVLDPWSLACDALVVPDFAGSGTALAQLPLGNAPSTAVTPVAAALAALRTALGALLHHGVAALSVSWGEDAAQCVAQLRGQHLHALGSRVEALRAEILAARANPRDARLGEALMAVAALAQLHEDALVQQGLGAAAPES